MATIEDLKTWIDRDLSRWGKAETHVEIIQDAPDHPTEPSEAIAKRSMRIRLYTNTNCYTISAHERTEDNGYLGCGASSRKPRAGEDWTRGSDLPDGPFNEETWRRILANIVSYEMVGLYRPNKFMLPDDIEPVEHPPIGSGGIETAAN